MAAVGEAYRKSFKEILEALNVDQKNGLASNDAERRLAEYGPNQLESAKKINPFVLFISQFNDVLVIVLIFAALISLGLSFVGHQEYTSGSDAEIATFLSEECADEAASNPLAGISATCSGVAGQLGSGWEYEGEDILCNSDAECNYASQIENHSESEGLTESLLIFAIVIAIALIGFLNEYKAEKTVEALRKLVGHSAKVIRDGKKMEVPSTNLVPGDIVLIEEGQKIPADLRLIDVKSLQVNEASLTGESLPVSKNTDVIGGVATLGDQKNMLFSGTFVTTGTGVAVVVSTGSSTEIGKIANMVVEVEDEQTPMQKKLDDLGRKLGALILLICIGVFGIIFFVDAEIANDPLIQRLIFAFTVAVALAVAAIPEGLSFVVRISLALGARRMAAKDALVRKLSAVEALGSTDVICSDKTGTLTKGEMTVREIFSNGKTFGVTGSGYENIGEFTFNDIH